MKIRGLESKGLMYHKFPHSVQLRTNMHVNQLSSAIRQFKSLFDILQKKKKKKLLLNEPKEKLSLIKLKLITGSKS